MRQSVKLIILTVILVMMILLAVFGYHYLTERYDIPNPTDIGSASPETPAAVDFTVTDREGNTVKLSEFFGKPIIINFWATWCGPCKSELPVFDEAYKKYGEDVTFLMVNLTDGYRDTVEAVKAFIEDTGYTFPVYFDTEYSGAYAYRVSSIPLTVLIDAKGYVYQSHVGAMNKSILEGYITGILSHK